MKLRNLSVDPRKAHVQQQKPFITPPDYWPLKTIERKSARTKLLSLFTSQTLIATTVNEMHSHNHFSAPQPRITNNATGARLTRQASMPMAAFGSTGRTQGFTPTLGGFNGAQTAGGSPNSGAGVRRTMVVRSATSAKETILTWVQQQVNGKYEVSFGRNSCLRCHK